MNTYFYEVKHEDGRTIVAPTFGQANSEDELIISIDLDYKITEEFGDGTWTVNVVKASEEVLNLKLAATLQEEKEKAYAKIDERTAEIIAEGFSFDGQTFSLSIYAQMNWTEMHTNKDILTFPMDVTTKDNNVYTLTYSNVVSFWVAGANAKQSAVNSGRVIKKLIYDCTSKTDVKAIEDNR